MREVEEECGLQGIELQDFVKSTYHIYSGDKGFILKRTDWYNMLYAGQSNPKPLVKEDISDVIWVKAGSMDRILSNTYPLVAELIKEVIRVPGEK